MGIFTKIKNILFEPDEEEVIEDMHVYTKEEVKEEQNKEEVVEKARIPEEPPIKATNTSHFSNIKRDIDIDYEDKKILDEVPGGNEVIVKTREEQSHVVAKPEVVKPSPFPSFDEKEFERVNSRVVKNEYENRMKRENKNVESEHSTNDFRKANNLFSSTTSRTEIKVEDNKNNINPTKKPFTPSPVISPVYGILDKNYRKDDIVDRQGGMKREKVVKPIEKVEVVEDSLEVDIDTVRKKAYGTLDDIEKEMKAQTANGLEENDTDIILENVKPDVLDTSEEIKVEVNNSIDLDDEIDDDLTLGDLINSQSSVNTDTDYDNNSVEDDLEKEFKDENEPSLEIKEPVDEKSLNQKSEKVKPRLLDDMEKTSTLQILDDIEKELNSIKPISKDVKPYDEDEMKEKIEKSETLENDLFNLIDSMYEQGEEEEDNG